MKRLIFWALLFSSLLPASAEEKLPEVVREFRAAWIASVDNIDFPSSRGLSASQQKSEMAAILDHAKSLNLNAVVFQVRPHADALYESPIEPWSEYLSGKMGKPPAPYYDPLAFAIEEAHKRGLLVHAWFNPFRAGHPAMKGAFSEDHISKSKPDIVKPYGKYLWMDPSEEEAREHSLRVIMDVVRRYDIDGIHFDDYFYPYPEKGFDFPDEKNWEAYQKLGGKLSRSDWRRKNVDSFIYRVFREIKKAKPEVMFGISPFGVWKPIPEESIGGFDAYNGLYADSRKWLREGWVDYLSPQLYWHTSKAGLEFPKLLRWWHRQNKRKRHLWPGIAAYRIGPEEGFTAHEVAMQLSFIRSESQGAGAIFFSYRSLKRDLGGIGQLLREEVYQLPAIPPLSAWIRKTPAKPPALKLEGNKALWEGEAFLWAAFIKRQGNWSYRILPAGEKTLPLEKAERFAIAAIDRLGNISKPKFTTGLGK